MSALSALENFMTAENRQLRFMKKREKDGKSTRIHGLPWSLL
jgi:hypothetical protein